MGEVKEQQDKIEAKLRVLDFTEGETSKILEGMDVILKITCILQLFFQESFYSS